MKRYRGIGASQGIAVGPVHLYCPGKVETGRIFIGQTAKEQLARYEEIKAAAREELTRLQAQCAQSAPEQANIFAAHCDLLADIVMGQEITQLVHSGQAMLDQAIEQIYNKYAAMMDSVGDPMFQERARDIEDVRDRLLRLCAGQTDGGMGLEGPCILAARDLLPSDTAALDRDKILAIVTEVGGQTSHSAIIARSYGIPALLGVGPFLSELHEGQTVAVDACEGELLADGQEEQWAQYRQRAQAFALRAEQTAAYLERPAITQDGVRVSVTLNIADPRDEELALAPYVDGVGLFRTEFLFLGRAELPDEEEQTGVYRKVLSAFGDKPVILRTLDIGGDKQADCLELPKEDNPFLGKRALRLCFDRPDVFRTQLRAALRASTAGNLWLMLPMVGSMDDIRRAKTFLRQVQEELDAEGTPYSHDVKLGIMVEIPSIALLAEQAAEEVDFASIGSNDLCQYLMAADRLNGEVSAYYQSMNPALFRLIGMVVDAFSRRGKPVSLCGELGGDPQAAVVLAGLGLRKLSMGGDAVPRIKERLCGIRMDQAQAAARQVCRLDTASAVEAYLRDTFPPNGQ